MLKKLKKWHIVIIIIIGIGGYWVSQNTWIFEKQIPVEDYEKTIIDKEWIKRSFLTSFNISSTGVSAHQCETRLFNVNNEFIIDSCLVFGKHNGEWKIQENELILTYGETNYSNFNVEKAYRKERIIVLTNNLLITRRGFQIKYFEILK